MAAVGQDDAVRSYDAINAAHGFAIGNGANISAFDCVIPVMHRTVHPDMTRRRNFMPWDSVLSAPSFNRHIRHDFGGKGDALSARTQVA